MWRAHQRDIQICLLSAWCSRGTLAASIYAHPVLQLSHVRIPSQGIAAWNGKHWSRIAGGKGARGTVGALAVNGTLLYIGGDFAGVGDVDAHGLASFDGDTPPKP